MLRVSLLPAFLFMTKAKQLSNFLKTSFQSFRYFSQRDLFFAFLLCLIAILGIDVEKEGELQILNVAAIKPIFSNNINNTSTPALDSSSVAPPKNVSPKMFLYSFNTPGVLYEAGGFGNSTSPYWWVDSGAKMIIENNIGKTIHNFLPSDDPWRLLYARNNSRDTDNGYHPQNIFRLITKNTWLDYTEEIYFKIDAYNLSASSNRNESNGLLLFNRYVDSSNLYYAGLRVDGFGVIKKKYKGTYYTMALSPVFPGSYNSVTSPNLLPLNTWIGVRTVVRNIGNQSVSISLYVDVGKTGNWIFVSQGTDNSISFGGSALLSRGHLGVRTDFMDADFMNYKITLL